MRKINKIIVHCSATKEGQYFTVADITRWHKERGFRTIGYHYVIYLDGTIEVGRTPSEVGAHCLGQNANSIGICYIGGLDSGGKPKDTRTPEQKESLKCLIETLCKRYPIEEIGGHRDYSPDKNGNGVIEPSEWLKDCPCFDVIPEFKYLLNTI